MPETATHTEDTEVFGSIEYGDYEPVADSVEAEAYDSEKEIPDSSLETDDRGLSEVLKRNGGHPEHWEAIYKGGGYSFDGENVRDYEGKVWTNPDAASHQAMLRTFKEGGVYHPIPDHIQDTGDGEKMLFVGHILRQADNSVIYEIWATKITSVESDYQAHEDSYAEQGRDIPVNEYEYADTDEETSDPQETLAYMEQAAAVETPASEEALMEQARDEAHAQFLSAALRIDRLPTAEELDTEDVVILHTPTDKKAAPEVSEAPKKDAPPKKEAAQMQEPHRAIPFKIRRGRTTFAPIRDPQKHETAPIVDEIDQNEPEEPEKPIMGLRDAEVIASGVDRMLAAYGLASASRIEVGPLAPQEGMRPGTSRRPHISSARSDSRQTRSAAKGGITMTYRA